jgi:protein TonB
VAAQQTIMKPAFRVDVSPQAIKRVESIGLDTNQQTFRVVMSTIIVLHVLLFVIKPSLLWTDAPMNLEESWEVDVDFLGDIAQKSPQETALPKAEISEQESVPMNLLPQLPKKFEVPEQQKIDEVNPDKDLDKVDESLAEKELVKPNEQIATPKTETDANKVDLDDLRKRLAVERLKEEKKVSERMTAQKNALAKLKQSTAAENADVNSGSSGEKLSLLRSNTYGNTLKSAVKRNFHLPENFKYSQTKMAVPLTVIIDERGDLVSLKLNGSSGNDVYDQAVLAALKNSVPLPPPPSHLAGREIQFNFGL